MSFRYSVNPNGDVVLKRANTGCATAIVIFMGVVFTVVGVGLLVYGGGIPMPFGIIRFIFPAIGFFVTILGITMPRSALKRVPDQLIFSNANGRVEIEQAQGTVNTAYIYYDEIAGFRIRIRTSSNSGSDTARRSRSYIIYLVKKDGGEWELLSYMSESSAQQDLQLLERQVQLDNAPKKVKLSLPQSPRFRISNSSSAMELDWRNSIGARPLVLLLVAAFVGAIAYILFSVLKDESGGTSVFGYIIGGIVITAFSLAIGYGFRKMFKDMSTDYAVVINRSALTYYERDKKGNEKRSVAVSLQELGSVVYSYASKGTGAKIYVYTKEQAGKKAELGDWTLSNLKDYWNLEQSVMKFEMPDLTPVEMLLLENYLQQAVAEKGNSNVA